MVCATRPGYAWRGSSASSPRRKWVRASLGHEDATNLHRRRIRCSTRNPLVAHDKKLVDQQATPRSTTRRYRRVFFSGFQDRRRHPLSMQRLLAMCRIERLLRDLSDRQEMRSRSASNLVADVELAHPFQLAAKTAASRESSRRVICFGLSLAALHIIATTDRQETMARSARPSLLTSNFCSLFCWPKQLRAPRQILSPSESSLLGLSRLGTTQLSVDGCDVLSGPLLSGVSSKGQNRTTHKDVGTNRETAAST